MRPYKNGSRCRGSHCPSWARTRTLLIQMGRGNQPNCSNLLSLTHLTAERHDVAVLLTISSEVGRSRPLAKVTLSTILPASGAGARTQKRPPYVGPSS